MPSPPRRSLAMPASASSQRALGRAPGTDPIRAQRRQAQGNTIAASTVSCLARSGSAMPGAPDAPRPVRGRSADRWVGVRDARRQDERVSARRASVRVGCVAASGTTAVEWPDPRMGESGSRPRSAPSRDVPDHGGLVRGRDAAEFCRPAGRVRAIGTLGAARRALVISSCGARHALRGAAGPGGS